MLISKINYTIRYSSTGILVLPFMGQDLLSFRLSYKNFYFPYKRKSYDLMDTLQYPTRLLFSLDSSFSKLAEERPSITYTGEFKETIRKLW
jgi:hypothetical protein